MPIILDSPSATTAYVAQAVEDHPDKPAVSIMDNFSGSFPLTELPVSDARYVFRKRTHARLLPTTNREFEFVEDMTAVVFTGRGPTREEAYEDWKNRVHSAFQELIAKRPFEFNDDDRQRWLVLSDLIDVEEYKRTTPIRVRQIGWVRWLGQKYPQAVRWADGRRDYIDLDEAPARFGGLVNNQWIEAVCERDPLTSKLLRITDVERISPIRTMTLDQQREFFDRLPTAESFPESNLD